MSKLGYKEVDSAIEGTVAVFKRLTKLSVKAFSLSELSFLDQSLSREMQSRLAHIVDNAADKKELLADVRAHTAYPNVTYAFMAHYIKTGERPVQARFELPSQQKMASKYRVLMPYLLTSMHADAYLVGFSSDDNAQLWFSAVSESSDSFDCIGYQGETRTISFSAVIDMGYKRIKGKQIALRNQCKSSLPSPLSSSSVKEAGFFISKKTLSEAKKSAAVDKLTKFLNSADLAPSQKPQEGIRIR